MALVDDREIRRVHREFLDDDSPTDVITFRYDGGDRAAGRGEALLAGGPFGELVISAETALREGLSRGVPPQLELLRYVVHGALHLLGHDDTTPRGRRRMRDLERRYLREFGDAQETERIQPPPRRTGPR